MSGACRSLLTTFRHNAAAAAVAARGLHRWGRTSITRRRRLQRHPPGPQRHLARRREAAPDQDAKGLIRCCSPTLIAPGGCIREELLRQPHNLVHHPDLPAQALRDPSATAG